MSLKKNEQNAQTQFQEKMQNLCKRALNNLCKRALMIKCKIMKNKIYCTNKIENAKKSSLLFIRH